MNEQELKQKCKELRKHQGWANYETWACSLWINNDRPLYEHFSAQAQVMANTAPGDERVKKGTWTAAEAAKFNLADYIKEYVEEHDPLADQASMYSDILRANLTEINYIEVAAGLLEGISIPEPGIPSHSSIEPGKFESSGDIGKKLHAITMESGQDDQLGDVEDFGWYALIIDTGISEVPHAIVKEDHDGFFDYTSYDTEEQARSAWAKLESEYSQFLGPEHEG